VGLFDGPQTWRYKPSKSYGSCTTEILALTGTPLELSKLRADDVIIDHPSKETLSPEEHGGKFFSETTEGRTENIERPADEAGEGVLRQPVSNSLHAGFGGPWKRVRIA
jgi:hypothetical protein